MKNRSVKKEIHVGAPTKLTVSSLAELTRYVKATGEVVPVFISAEAKLSEYKKMVEYADSMGYQLMDDVPDAGHPWRSRVENKLLDIEQKRNDLAKKTDRLRQILEQIEKTRNEERNQRKG
ncbi:uncharacterized protein LOC144715213 [Wolffia australiana]